MTVGRLQQRDNAMPAIGGGPLASADGSLYYGVAGISLVAVAVLLWCGNAKAGWFYNGFRAVTLLWSL